MARIRMDAEEEADGSVEREYIGHHFGAFHPGPNGMSYSDVQAG